MRFFAVAASAVSLLVGFSAHALEAEAPKETIEAIALKDPDRVLCSYFYHEGVVIRRPLCKSAREWYADREQERRDITDLQLRRLQLGR